MNGSGEKGMTIIVKTITRLTLGFILLYGIYVALIGHISAGGGFAGGVIVALSFVHIMLAFGRDVALRRLHSYMFRVLISAGAIAFLFIVMVSFTGGCVPVNRFFMSRIGCHIFNNEVTIPFCEMVIVGSGLFGIFIALVLLTKSDKESE